MKSLLSIPQRYYPIPKRWEGPWIQKLGNLQFWIHRTFENYSWQGRNRSVRVIIPMPWRLARFIARAFNVIINKRREIRDNVDDDIDTQFQHWISSQV